MNFFIVLDIITKASIIYTVDIIDININNHKIISITRKYSNKFIENKINIFKNMEEENAE